MKKTLLTLFTVALAATCAMAQPQLTKNWEINTGVPGSAAGGELRFMTVKDGKILVTDKANKKIVAFDANGQTDYFDLSDALATHYNGASAGVLIATDDAGNILVNSNFPNAPSGTDFIIISADLKNTYKLQIAAPVGLTAARVDQMGRIVGDMLSEEGAYMWLCYNNTTKVAIIKVTNGAQDLDKSVSSNTCAVSVNTSCVAQPVFNTVAEIEALTEKSSSFWFRNRSYAQDVYQWNSSGTEQTAISLIENSNSGATTKNATQEGFEVFTLGNEIYFVVPMTTDGTANGRSTNWGIYAASNKKLVATWEENPQIGKGQGMGGFYVEKVDNNTVLIYHFLAGSVVGCYTFIDDVSVGVENIEIANAPVEYYNLQGMKVENPSNGIFIKRQGAKATKVVL